MTARPPRRLLRRLFVGQLLVVMAGAVTLGVVAFLVAPPIFDDHVHRAIGPVSDVVAHHLDTALTETLVLALAIGIVTSAATAAGVSWLLASRIVRPAEELSRAAHDLATGHLDARAVRPDGDDELADLTATFNDMADALEHTERTRQRLLADLAHELRTPLATVEAYHEGIADGIVAADETTIGVLTEATGRLRRLVEDVALVSRAEEGHLALDLEAVDLGWLATTAVEAVRPTAGQAGITVRADVSDDPVVVDADRDRLGQVLDNLLANAIRHTPEGGTITVRVVRADGEAQLTVVDTGTGIDAQHLPHVFERFYRADPARRHTGGSGIGLTVSRAIVVSHAGELTAASGGPGRGATFTIRLPLARQS